MSADPASSSTTRTAPLALWRVAEAFLHTLYNLFGAPEDVAAAHTLLREAHAHMASWLRCAEAMLRRLLLIEAQAYATPNTRLVSPKLSEGGPLVTPSRQREPRLIGFDADKPEAWRVSFRCFGDFSSPVHGGSGIGAANDDGGANAHVSDACPLHRPLSHASRDSAPASVGANRFKSAWPLAERYEALIRVFNDPAPYARRLARRLHATPHRVVETLRAPPEAEHRIDHFEALTHQAEAPWRQRFSSA